MSVLTQKFSEDEMYRALGTLLKPDEGIMAAIYCVYKDTGFFASSRHIMYGYAAITDQNRFVGFRSSFINTTALQFDMDNLIKLKISNALFGQKMVYAVFNDGFKSYKIKFQFSRKIYGVKFPHHTDNANILTTLLLKQQDLLR